MVCKDDRILLGMKKAGFGVGRWNGFGGKVEEGETIEAAALRELREEVGIEAKDMKKVGVLDFTFAEDPKVLEVHIFKATDYSGEPAESNEMRPEWFTFDSIPYSQMWPDDEQWLPLVLEGKSFTGAFHFDRPSDADYCSKILEHKLELLP